MVSKWLKVALGVVCVMLLNGTATDIASASSTTPIQIIEIKPSSLPGEAYIIVKNTSTEPFMLISSKIIRGLPSGVWVMPNMTLDKGRLFDGLEEVKLVATSGTLTINKTAGVEWAYIDYRWAGEEGEDSGRLYFGECLAEAGWQEGTVCRFDYEIIGGGVSDDGRLGEPVDDQDNDGGFGDHEEGDIEIITVVEGSEGGTSAAAEGWLEVRRKNSDEEVLALVSGTDNGNGISSAGDAEAVVNAAVREGSTKIGTAIREIDYFAMTRGRLKAAMVVLIATCLLWVTFGCRKERRGNIEPRHATI